MDYIHKQTVSIHVHIPLSMFDYALEVINRGAAYVIGGTLHCLRNQWIFAWTAPKHVCIVSISPHAPSAPPIS
eukprot:10540538-Karenia_brevis.AAC.1